jgi:hypothetical protein
MRANTMALGGLALLLAASLALPVVAQEEKKAEKQTEEKKAEPAKAKAEKVSGDICLLDTEKNYMIVVTKEGEKIIATNIEFVPAKGE